MKRRYNIDNYLIEMSASEAEQLFGLTDRYTAADVKKIWRKLSLQHHPDKGGSTEMMKKVNAAYDLLKSGGTVKKMSQQDKAAKYWKKINKNRDIAKKHIEKEFDSSIYVKHLETVTGLKFEIDNEEIVVPNTSPIVMLKVRFKSVKGYDTFDLSLTIHMPSLTQSLSGQDQKEEYEVTFSGDAILSGKKYKLYHRNRGIRYINSLDISDPELLFPKAKIKRHMKRSSKKSLKKRDVEAYFRTAKRVRTTSQGDYAIELKDEGMYIIVTRQVFMRKGLYRIGLYKRRGQYSYDAINEYIALVPEGPNEFLEMLEELGKSKSTDVIRILKKYKNKIEDMHVRVSKL